MSQYLVFYLYKCRYLQQMSLPIQQFNSRDEKVIWHMNLSSYLQMTDLSGNIRRDKNEIKNVYSNCDVYEITCK